MTVLQHIEWEPPLLEPRRDRELERWLRKRVGLSPPATAYLSGCPRIVRMEFELDLAPLVHVDHELRGLVALVVSRDNSCRFCYAATRMLLGVMGMPEARIQKLEQALQSARLDSRIEPALDFARRISRANPLPSVSDRKALAEAGYSDEAIKELAFAAGLAVLANRLSTLPALPPKLPERLAEGRLLRVLRPLLSWRLGAFLRRAGRSEFLADDLKHGPYTYLVLALDGLPAARALRTALDEVWASPHTTPRAKALVFAVVARGLGCHRPEREAFRLLEEEGLGEEQAERILADLAGPELDPVEAAFLPYARETLWYEPAPIQRRGRSLLQQLAPEPFLELIGVASLANMVCRLGVLLDEP